MRQIKQMSKIFTIMGKSATGKDHIYKDVLRRLNLTPVITYTTRPIRQNEREGVEYHFVTEEEMVRLETAGVIIEKRCYHTVAGDWYYFTCDDGQITDDKDALMIVTPEAYVQIRDYYGAARVVPVYIESNGGDRLRRSLKREEKQAAPNYAEVCRRFLADEEDFSEEKLSAYGIGPGTRFDNNAELADCVERVVAFIQGR